MRNIYATRLNQSQEPSLPSQVPIYIWVERSNYSSRCLAQGHKCHNRDSNPHAAEQKHQSSSSVLLSTRPRHPTFKHFHFHRRMLRQNECTFRYFQTWTQISILIIGNCQRLVFTVGVSQHMHKITNV